MRTPIQWKPLASLALAALLVGSIPPIGVQHSASATNCGFTRALRIMQSVDAVKKRVPNAAPRYLRAALNDNLADAGSSGL